MSPDQPHRPDDLLPGEAHLHDALGAAEPPAEADLAVLRRARAAVRDESPGVRRAWTPMRLAAWTGSAAVVMLAVAVVLQLRAPDGMPAESTRAEQEPPPGVLHDAAEFRQRSSDAVAPQAAPPAPAEPMLERADGSDQSLDEVQVTGSRISRTEMEKIEAAETRELDDTTAGDDQDRAPPPRYAGVEPPPSPDEWRAALRAWQALGAQEVFLAELSAFQATYPDEDAP